MPLIPIPAGSMAVGLNVTLPDGRSGVVRHFYDAWNGQTVILRLADASMYVTLARQCRVDEGAGELTPEA
jgi:hypothetical protein